MYDITKYKLHCYRKLLSRAGRGGKRGRKLTEGVEVGAVVPPGQQVREEVRREGVEWGLQVQLGPRPHLSMQAA